MGQLSNKYLQNCIKCIRENQWLSEAKVFKAARIC